jgi:hypothetical protein
MFSATMRLISFFRLHSFLAGCRSPVLLAMLPGDDSQHDSDDSHYNYFGSLTMLLSLVTAINNGGKPILLIDAPAYRGALETSQPASDVVLNAVAAILVRNNEIIAATA